MERFFAKFFGFLFDNMYWCYPMFASLFPLLLAFNFFRLLLINGLEYFANLGIAYISYSTHTLFEYSLYWKICIWRSKHSQVFYTLSEFSFGTRVGTL